LIVGLPQWTEALFTVGPSVAHPVSGFLIGVQRQDSFTFAGKSFWANFYVLASFQANAGIRNSPMHLLVETACNSFEAFRFAAA
jgi:hypothetical protein